MEWERGPSFVFETSILSSSEIRHAYGVLFFLCFRLLQPDVLRTTPDNILGTSKGGFISSSQIRTMLLSKGLDLLICFISLWARFQAWVSWKGHPCFLRQLPRSVLRCSVCTSIIHCQGSGKRSSQERVLSWSDKALLSLLLRQSQKCLYVRLNERRKV